MKRAMRWFGVAALAVGLSMPVSAVQRPMSGADIGPKEEPPKPDPKSIGDTVLQFKVKDIDGKEIDLAQYYGKVLLIVNTASKCGYTPQYTRLQELHEKYTGQGFEVLAFPANNFGGQEPGTNEQIKEFCKQTYAVSFPLFSKVSVKGKDICDLFKFLTDKKKNPAAAGDIKWNFEKFVIGRDGKVLGQFRSADDPVKNKKLIQAIEKALAVPKPGAKKS